MLYWQRKTPPTLRLDLFSASSREGRGGLLLENSTTSNESVNRMICHPTFSRGHQAQAVISISQARAARNLTKSWFVYSWSPCPCRNGSFKRKRIKKSPWQPTNSRQRLRRLFTSATVVVQRRTSR